ncbi:MAG TPA: hypothetical protein VF342_13535 [Alphaproteobacteria bacterium]
MLKALIRRWRGASVATPAALIEFLDHRAALVAQKSIIGYCHVKTRLPLSELTIEKQFADAFEISRWEGYAAVLADLVVMTEGYLRPFAGSRAGDLVGPLAGIYEQTLAIHPRPGHRPEGWAADVERLRQRLLAAQAGPVRQPAEVALNSAERLYETLPIHSTLREPDKPAIVANVQFMIVGLAHEFRKQLDCAALVAELLPIGDTA